MQKTSLSQLADIYDSGVDDIHAGYLEFLRFASISTDPEYADQVIACKDWLAKTLSAMGMQVETWPTSGHPCLFAQDLRAGKDKPTLLIYNHYDVQPVDPLELWQSPPFEPVIRDGEVYARGASDNKGQCWYVVQALNCLYQRDGRLPVNVKYLIEGEEEVGSKGLSEIIAKRTSALRADYLAVVDLSMVDRDTPAVTLGLRGIVTMTLKLRGSNMDLHSGLHGGVAFNPLHALARILADLRNDQGRVQVPGFYDEVKGLSDSEREQVDFSFDLEEYKRAFGTLPTGGEKGLPPTERQWIRPTIEINGIRGGYGGEGFKTVIPAEAIAKISCRLVPNQDPTIISERVRAFIEKRIPPGITHELFVHPGIGEAVRTSPSSTIARAMSQAYEEVFETSCRSIMGGGSVPIVPTLARASGGQVVMMGVALSDDAVHAPNEHFGLNRLRQGCLAVARALEILGG